MIWGKCNEFQPQARSREQKWGFDWYLVDKSAKMMSHKTRTKCKRAVFCLLPLYLKL